jgi:hypothetical protein
MVSCQCLLRNPGKHRFQNAFTGIILARHVVEKP